MGGLNEPSRGAFPALLMRRDLAYQRFFQMLPGPSEYTTQCAEVGITFFWPSVISMFQPIEEGRGADSSSNLYGTPLGEVYYLVLVGVRRKTVFYMR